MRRISSGVFAALDGAADGEGVEREESRGIG